MCGRVFGPITPTLCRSSARMTPEASSCLVLYISIYHEFFVLELYEHNDIFCPSRFISNDEMIQIKNGICVVYISPEANEG